MDAKFRRVAGNMVRLLDELQGSRLLDRHQLDGIPARGIYVFYEHGNPMYVGRSNRLKNRIQTHGRDSANYNSASFAFRLALERLGIPSVHFPRREVRVKPKFNVQVLGIEHGYATREELARNCQFDMAFRQQKERVRAMQVRVVEVDDPIEQTIFEVYATLALGTELYNQFDNHDFDNH